MNSDIENLKKLRSFHNGSYAKSIDNAIKALRIVEIIEGTFFDRGSNLMMDFDDWKDIKGFIEKGGEE